MNARKAVLADNPELILRVLQLRFDESLSYPRISAQTGVSKTAIFSLVRRFHQVFTDWPLSGEYSCGQLARALFPGRYPSAPTVTQPVKAEKPRRNRFSPEFKWRLVQQTLLSGACVAQIARENGINVSAPSATSCENCPVWQQSCPTILMDTNDEFPDNSKRII